MRGYEWKRKTRYLFLYFLRCVCGKIFDGIAHAFITRAILCMGLIFAESLSREDMKLLTEM